MSAGLLLRRSGEVPSGVESHKLFFFVSDKKTIYALRVLVPGQHFITLHMDKLQLTGQNLGRVFNFRNGRVHAVHLLCRRVKLPNLKLKTWPKQLLGYVPLDIALPALHKICR